MAVAIGIAGAGGRMGRELVATILDEPRAYLAGGTIRRGRAPMTGTDGRPAGIEAIADPAALFAAAEVVIDVSTPKATSIHARLAAETGRALVVGTTGLGAKEQAALDSAAEKAPVLQAANFSLGVNLLLALSEQAARALGPDFDAEIVEMHHRHKVDAPSGTALALGHAVASGRGVALDDVARYAREGRVGPRPEGEIGFAVLRGGDIVGEHRVCFAGPGERIALEHAATTRAVFARGAVAAALWLAGRPPGRYGMRDVLFGGGHI